MESYSTSNPAQSLNTSALIKFLYQFFRQEADQVRRSSGSEAEVFYDNAKKLHLNSLASSSFRSTSGDCLDLVRGLLSQNRLWYSNSVAIMLSNELNGKFILSLGTLESCSTSHAQSLNPRLPDPLIKFLCRLFQKEAGAFLCSEAQAMRDNTRKQYLNSLAPSHIQSTPRGCIDVLRGLLWYSSSFPDMLRYQLKGQFIQSVATEHYSSAIDICISLASEVASHSLLLEFILNSPSLMASNKRRRAFGLSKELVPNCPELLRPYRIHNIEGGFGCDFELSGIGVQNLADDLDCVITGNSSSSLCWLPIAETKNGAKEVEGADSPQLDEEEDSSSDRTEAGEGEDEGGDNSSHSSDAEAGQGGEGGGDRDGSDDDPDVGHAWLRVIQVFERTVHGNLIRREDLRGTLVQFRGYASLAGYLKDVCPYNAPPDGFGHILWPWPNHSPIFFDAEGGELDPRTRWRHFISQVTVVLMVPVEGAPAYLRAEDASHLLQSPLYYRLRFSQIPVRDRIRLIRRSALTSYRDFFWIINGLWAVWRSLEPLDAQDIMENNVVHEARGLLLRRPDEIRYYDEDGQELEVPTFLQLLRVSQLEQGHESMDRWDERTGSMDVDEATFLSRVRDIVIIKRPPPDY